MMKRAFGMLLAGAAVVVIGACAPDDDQVQVQDAEEVQAPAPVMPQDTVMMDHDTMHDDTDEPPTEPREEVEL